MREFFLLIEYLTDELWRLVGRGCRANKLSEFPTLKEVAQVGEAGEGKLQAQLLAFIRAAIASLRGCYEFLGKTVHADVLKRCFLVLMKLEASNESAPARRSRVIESLVRADVMDPKATRTWRDKNSGLEHALLRILAEHMVRQSGVAA